MGSLSGLAYWALQNQAMGDALIVSVGMDKNGQPVQRCMVAEMGPNRLAQGNVPQIRFVCDGFCGIAAKRPSKQCRTIDRQMVAGGPPVAPPPGLVRDTGSKVATPYRSGAAAAGGGGRVISIFGR